MKYVFTIYERKTNKKLFTSEVEGADKQQCAAEAVKAGEKAGFNLIRSGKGIYDVEADIKGTESPYKFQMKCIEDSPAEAEERILSAAGVPKEKRTDHIHMKVLPSVKRIAEKNAAAEGRTLSNYIEKLIQDDEKRKAGK